MVKNVLFLIVGVIVGVAGANLVSNDPGHLPKVEEGDHAVADVGTMDLPQALTEIKKLKEENQSLKARQSGKPRQMVTLSPKEDEAIGKSDEESKDEKREARQNGMESRIMAMMENRIQGRISRLKSAIKMTDQQSTLVEAFLRERGELEMEYRRLRFSGEITPEQEAEYTEKLQGMSVSNFLKDHLSEEQYNEYGQYLQEQNQAELESYVSRQLSNLVQTVRLTGEQKDQAYQVFYQEAYSSIPEGEEFSARRRMYGPEAADNMATQLIALEGILNEEQMAIYRTQVETRAQSFQGGGGRSRGPGGR